jgi:hypothetical protein
VTNLAIHRLYAACLRILRPLARVLLRNGVTAHEFSQIAEAAFVAAAEDVLREQDRKPSFSRIASLTGIHRHAVSAKYEAASLARPDLLAQKEYQRNRVARVLSGWFEHPEYTDLEGRPRTLPLQGSEPSFSDLVRRFSGDIYPGIILDELQRAGAIRTLRNGTVQPIARRFTPGGADPGAIEHVGNVASDVINTLERNIVARESDRLFEDSTVSLNLPAAAVPLFKRWVERRAGPLLSDLEGWLGEQEAQPTSGSSNSERIRAGLSVVMFTAPQDGGCDSRVDTD